MIISANCSRYGKEEKDPQSLNIYTCMCIDVGWKPDRGTSKQGACYFRWAHKNAQTWSSGGQ